MWFRLSSPSEAPGPASRHSDLLTTFTRLQLTFLDQLHTVSLRMTYLSIENKRDYTIQMFIQNFIAL